MLVNTTLAAEIIAFATSARIAQETMSSQSDPMVIKQFRFLIKYESAVTVRSETEIGFTYWRVSVKEKLNFEYKDTTNFEVECIIVPVVKLYSENGENGDDNHRPGSSV